MKSSFRKRVLALLMAAIMIIGIAPMSVFAAEADEQNVASETPAAVQVDEVAEASNITENGLPVDMTMVSDKESTLAPGIIERQITAYDKNGDRVLLYVATADMSVDTVEVYANYKDNDPSTLGMQKTTEQAAAFEANHEGKKVVVAINGSYYNTGNGKPNGAFVMEGKHINNDSDGNSRSFFAIMKDGTAMIGAANEYTTYKDQIQEAISGQIHLIKDGAICAGLDTKEKYPRQTIGITSDGQVIIMTADCLSAVGSAGLTIYEQAEVMLSLGCIEAVHLDGGGSGTYCSRPAGTDKLVVTSNPSNGTERAVSNSLILVSTAKADGEFDSVILTANHSYITPGSSVEISAVGLDSTNSPAEIPADVIWQLADDSLGTVENGVFTSNGTVGTAVVQMVYDDEIVGSTTIEVVVPDTLTFGGQESIVIPYGKSVDLPVKALYNGKNVFITTENLIITLADESAASVNGLTITAPSADSGITGTSVMVCLKDDETVAVSAALVFGKGSEVIFDFEEGTSGTNLDNWIIRTHESKIDNNEQGEIYIVNEETGMVRNGEQALAFHADFSQSPGSGSSTAGYIALSLSWNGDPISVAGAKNIGFWLYIPEDAMTTEIIVNTVYYDAKGNAQRRSPDGYDDNGEMIYTPYWGTKMEGSGWHYIKADLSKYNNDLLIKDEPNLGSAFKRNFFIKLYCVSGADSVDLTAYHGNFTYYIDDITVDYSDAVEDRELPVFSAAHVNAGPLDNVALNYGKTPTVNYGEVTFTANVADNTLNNAETRNPDEDPLIQNNRNATGIDAETAKVFVDGNAVEATYANGMITTADLVLTDGYHTIRFEIADNSGNVGYITRTINVNAGSELPTVQLVPHDASLNRLLSGSVYWVDLVSDEIANIDTIETTLNLNSVHSWELEHMVVADGFDVTYSATAAQAVENNVTLTIERNGEAVDADSNVIVSIPIRVWESLLYTYPGHTKTPQELWNKTTIDNMNMIVKVDQGLVTFVDDTQAFFSDRIDVEHEAYTSYFNMDPAYYAEKKAAGGYHTHTATALTDLAATCTEAGYTGRTFCAVCDSAVDWGTTVEATGHSYDFVDGILQCTCGELFNGEYTDGKIYENGVVVGDGWVGESYYADGVKLTGVHKVPAPDASGEFYYDFGEDGICAGLMKFIGLFYDETASAYRYSKMGVLEAGWIQIDKNWHYFDTTTMNAVTGEYYYASRGVTYYFDETGMTEGAWQVTKNGTRYWYGKWYYEATGSRICFVEIDGKTYNFDQNGYLTTGIHALYDDWTHDQRNEMRVWEFDENGVLVGEITTKGLVDSKRGFMYLIEDDGFVHGGYANGRLTSYNGELYFVSFSGKVKQNASQVITSANSNGLLPNGTYYFGDDCKLYNGIKEESDGLLYFYKDGKLANGTYNSELVELNGNIYLVKWSGKIAVNETREVAADKTNGLLPAGTYFFGEDGALYTESGIVWNELEQQYYYYQNGKLAKGIYNSELVEIDGEIYLIKWSGKVAFNETRVIPADKTNGLLPAGTYYFGADGKLFTGMKEEDDGLLYYYQDGKLCNGTYYSELVEIDGAIYLIKWSGKVAFNETRVIPADKTNGLLPAGTYYFGADGKLFTGVKEDADGLLYYYKDGKLGNGMYYSELIEVDGSIYLIKWSGKVAADETRVIPADKTNGLLPAGTYYFGADGKLQK